MKVNKEPTPISSLKGRGLYRNLDVEFVKNLRSERKIPVDVVLRETEEGFELIYTPIDSKLSPLVGRVGEGLFPSDSPHDPHRASPIRSAQHPRSRASRS